MKDGKSFVETGIVEKVEDLTLFMLAEDDWRDKREVVEFTKKIGWVISQHASISSYHGGKKIGEHGTFVDWTGFGSIITDEDGAISEAEEFCKSHDISSKSSLVVKVETWQLVRPFLADEKYYDKLEFNRTQYTSVPRSWSLDRSILDELADIHNGVQKQGCDFLARLNKNKKSPEEIAKNYLVDTVRHSQIIWSSLSDPETNDFNRQNYVKNFVLPVKERMIVLPGEVKK